MGLIHSIMTLLYLILISMAMYIPYRHQSLPYFQAFLLLNMLATLLSVTTHSLPLPSLFMAFLVLGYLFIKQRKTLWTHPDGRHFIWRLSCYIMAVTSLCFGSFLLITLMPPVISFWFKLLYALSLVFLLTLPYYLYFSWYLRQTKPQKSPDILLVLGAGIVTESVSPLLRARLDAAFKISHNKTNWIVSGGQGADEPISEALAMQHYLIQLGIPSEQITLEDQSTNTQENIKYSQPSIPSHAYCTIVTSDFHLLRALRIAQRFKLSADGYGAISPLRYRARSYLHDYCGVLLHYPYAWLVFVLIHILFSIL
ncbi:MULTISPECIES: YdcF family protein [unclassified Staphylococcus]|uniref:YdcF family protein n=1 Tax=unclassified Staphylococcus TaxID=91994 RepID=UPI0021D36E36|nr:MULTISPECIES: YdcF family protein [unclassified Staphylococcus]UXR69365.1 YdcF family protein [Staphylococcus sp. IVB6246]UXR71421.1 YdcF family protein [Staphylococcus sp. IVB6240]UXR73699.1 YdcF family protein [Staphylococcus sp. IVB6238]UXR76017.1 YdcF family protein [Staphylococcus sp. IVB6233]UXR80214.1 YdcF family protein [Staphylococcus sp. IVB6218]